MIQQKAYVEKMILSVIEIFNRKDMIYKACGKKSNNLINNLLDFLQI